MSSVSIILPYTRFDGFHACVAALYSNHGNIKFELVSEYDHKRWGCNPMVNLLVDRSKHEIVCFLHDDSIPQPGFLDEAVKVMKTFDGGWGTVGFNDMIHDEDGPCTHWMIHKNMLQYFPDGVFYSEQYFHTRVDRELKEVSKAAGRYKWAENAKILHLNPIYTQRNKRDMTSRLCYSKKNIRHDKEVYERRRRENGNVWAALD